MRLARASDGSIRQIAKELGVSDQSLRNWMAQAKVDAAVGFYERFPHFRKPGYRLYPFHESSDD